MKLSSGVYDLVCGFSSLVGHIFYVLASSILGFYVSEVVS